MTGEEKAQCPVCGFSCKTTAVLCPDCGLQFDRWLSDNPGKSITGWDPAPHTPTTPPAPVPVDQPQSPDKGLTPEARLASAMLLMENAQRKLQSPGGKAGRRAGQLMMVIGIWSLIGSAAMGYLDNGTASPGTFLGIIDALVLFPLGFGAFKGKRNSTLGGAGYLALSTIVSLFLPKPSLPPLPGMPEMPGMPVADMAALGPLVTLVVNGILVAMLARYAQKMEE